jgi:hypothetical protein
VKVLVPGSFASLKLFGFRMYKDVQLLDWFVLFEKPR